MKIDVKSDVMKQTDSDWPTNIYSSSFQ